MNTMEKSLLAYLYKYPNGVSESILIADMNTYPGRNVRRALSSTFGVYIDRWEWSPLKNDFVPVYRAVEVPPDAKKPGCEWQQDRAKQVLAQMRGVEL